jgi:hypothetical protein
MRQYESTEKEVTKRGGVKEFLNDGRNGTGMTSSFKKKTGEPLNLDELDSNLQR